jgi:hypothetical protein
MVLGEYLIITPADLPDRLYAAASGSLAIFSGDAPHLAAGEEMRRAAPSRLVLEVDVGAGWRRGR